MLHSMTELLLQKTAVHITLALTKDLLVQTRDWRIAERCHDGGALASVILKTWLLPMGKKSPLCLVLSSAYNAKPQAAMAIDEVRTSC
mmetsp:Transcript_133408/g.231786  ORF Transcript_133408/g.231786 Transcript_133408/m.231786 type:complete len:88 (+) Transcript_133408:1391-1654(+)